MGDRRACRLRDRSPEQSSYRVSLRQDESIDDNAVVEDSKLDDLARDSTVSFVALKLATCV